MCILYFNNKFVIKQKRLYFKHDFFEKKIKIFNEFIITPFRTTRLTAKCQPLDTDWSIISRSIAIPLRDWLIFEHAVQPRRSDTSIFFRGKSTHFSRIFAIRHMRRFPGCIESENLAQKQTSYPQFT